LKFLIDNSTIKLRLLKKLIEIRRKNLLLFGLALSVSMISLTDSMVNIALPTIIVALHIDLALSSWISISSLLIITCTIIIFGKLGDLKGRKQFTFLGITIFIIGGILCATAQSGILLIVYRGIQGLGSSLLISNIYAIPKDIFPKNKHGRSIGLITFGVYVGLTIGPFLSGLLIDFLNWNSIFLIALPIGIISLIIIQYSFKFEPIEKFKGSFDYIGAITLALMLFSLYLALTFSNKIGWTSIIIIAFLIIFVILFLSFIYIEKRVEDPMIKLSLFKNLNFSTSSFASLLFYISTLSISFLIPIYLKSGLGYFGLMIALTIFPMPLLMSIFTPLAGYLSDKFVNRRISIIGLFIVSLSFLMLAFLNFESPISYIILIISGIGQGLFTAPNVGLILNSVDSTKRGIASSLSTMMRTIGQSGSYAISTAILGIFIPFGLLNTILNGTISPTPDQFELFKSSMQFVFFVMCFINTIALFLIALQFLKKSK